MRITPDHLSKRRVSLRFLLLVVALVVIVGTGVAMWPTLRYIIKWRRFSAEHQNIRAIVDTWREPPRCEEPLAWREVWGTAITSFGNICFSPDHVSLEEMARLREDIERKSQEPITFETLEWLRRRLAQTGPHGKHYITRFQPMWDEVKEFRKQRNAEFNVNSEIGHTR